MNAVASVKEQKNRNKMNLCTEDKILYAVLNVLMILFVIIILYPLIYVVSCSLSDGAAVASGRVVLWPVDFSLKGYQLMLSYRQVWTGYANTIFYTVVGTALNLVMTTMVAYPLSRRRLFGKKFFILAFMIPMWFSGGLIPNYILMTRLGLNGTRWALILSQGTISIYNMIIMRTYFQNSIPYELFEAAKVDGISDFRYLFDIVIPLSKAIFAVITLYYAVAHWNSYFDAMLYLRDRDLYPLQMVLRDILNVGTIDMTQFADPELIKQMSGVSQSMNYALIVIGSVPLLVAYPFVQKFFEKGVMIGSVKG